MRRTTAALLAAACLALAGCSSGGEPEKKTVTVTATTRPTTPAATPALSRADTKRQCSGAVAEAAPGWDDWNFDPGDWADDPRTPAVCRGLTDEDDPTQGNRDFMGALLDGLGMANDPRAGS
ncbi:hypothetical protein [Streptomyces sp. Root369]|uniref:hypothetical protein n=1 Tax=Streptomyces sp. Root369 TaxID=1736523 RepID=UPI00070F3F35|nr:hypothetical protein [Streptomyces sp. Root369]KQW06950.1 hypothetical protein ASD08_05000 [Streptomyces sp. Root369]